jgi:hypothetical protein
MPRSWHGTTAVPNRAQARHPVTCKQLFQRRIQQSLETRSKEAAHPETILGNTSIVQWARALPPLSHAVARCIRHPHKHTPSCLVRVTWTMPPPPPSSSAFAASREAFRCSASLARAKTRRGAVRALVRRSGAVLTFQDTQQARPGKGPVTRGFFPPFFTVHPDSRAACCGSKPVRRVRAPGLQKGKRHRGRIHGA